MEVIAFAQPLADNMADNTQWNGRQTLALAPASLRLHWGALLSLDNLFAIEHY